MRIFLTEEDYKKAKSRGISRELADTRFYDEGMTLKQTLAPVKVEIKKSKLTKEERQKYLKIALENGINYQRFMWRIDNDWTPEEASTVGIGKRRKAGTFSEKERQYIEKAKELGVSFDTYYIRRCRGWSKEKASTTPLRGHKRKRVEEKE